MHITRRGALKAATAIPLAFALGGCLNAQQIIALTEQVLSDIQNVEAALGNVVPAALEATINGYLAQIDALLKGLNVGGIVPPVTAAAIFSDLQIALDDVAGVLPGNPTVMAAQIVLAAIAAVWGAVGPNLGKYGAVANDNAVSQARARLAALPRHRVA